MLLSIPPTGTSTQRGWAQEYDIDLRVQDLLSQLLNIDPVMTAPTMRRARPNPSRLRPRASTVRARIVVDDSKFS